MIICCFISHVSGVADYKFSQFDSAVTILYSNVARCLELVNPETGLLVGLLAFSASPFSASSRTRIVPSTSTSTSTSTSAAPVPTSPKKRDEPRSVLSSMLQDALASSSLNQQHSELDKPSVPFATVAGDNISLLLTNSTLCVFSATALPHSHASPTLDLAQLEPHKSFSIASIAAMVLPHLNIDADQSVDGPHRIDTDDLCIVLRDGTWFWLRLLPNERDILVGLINRSRALSIEDSVPLYELVCLCWILNFFLDFIKYFILNLDNGRFIKTPCLRCFTSNCTLHGSTPRSHGM
jgi:hypothetical protein